FFRNTLVKAGHLMRPSAQHKVPRGHEDEGRLTADIIEPCLASTNGYQRFDVSETLVMKTVSYLALVTAISSGRPDGNRAACTHHQLVGPFLMRMAIMRAANPEKTAPARKMGVLPKALFTFVATFLVSGALVVAAPIDSADIHVIDGDTIRVHRRQPDV